MSNHNFDYGPDPHDEDPPEFNMGMVAVKRKQVADAAYARGFAAGVEQAAGYYAHLAGQPETREYVMAHLDELLALGQAATIQSNR